jgi:hypothetical protein
MSFCQVGEEIVLLSAAEEYLETHGADHESPAVRRTVTRRDPPTR